MTDGFKVHGCSVTEDGVCAMHGVEIERRTTDRRDLDAVKKDIEKNRQYIGALLTFKNIAIGVSVFGMMVLSGGYLYTYTHVQASEIKYREYAMDLKALDDKVNALSTRLAVVDERYIALTAQMATLNERLAELIAAMNANRVTQGASSVGNRPMTR